MVSYLCFVCARRAQMRVYELKEASFNLSSLLGLLLSLNIRELRWPSG